MFGCLLFILSGCSWMYAIGGEEESNFDISESGMQVTDLAFVNQEGEAMQTSDFDGQYWLASMIFTSCPEICPVMSPNMQSLQATAIEEDLPIHFVSFTVDPDRDSPELLKQYGSNLGVDYDSWTFTTGYEFEEIQEFSLETFKAPLEKVDDGADFIHNTSFFLINNEGEIIRKYDGLELNQTDIVKDMKSAVETE